MITAAELDNWFTYHAPKEGDQERYVAIRNAAKEFAAVIVTNTIPCADQTAAIRLVRQAAMTANQSIACGGK